MDHTYDVCAADTLQLQWPDGQSAAYLHYLQINEATATLKNLPLMFCFSFTEISSSPRYHWQYKIFVPRCCMPKICMRFHTRCEWRKMCADTRVAGNSSVAVGAAWGCCLWHPQIGGCSWERGSLDAAPTQKQLPPFTCPPPIRDWRRTEVRAYYGMGIYFS